MEMKQAMGNWRERNCEDIDTCLKKADQLVKA